MKILFMTISHLEDVEDYSMYCDLLRCFRDNGHDVYTISPYEKRTERKTEYVEKNGVHMLHVKTGDIKKTKNLIKKGLATISVEPIFIQGIKKYFSDVKFVLVLYSTPPITFAKTVKYVKNRDGAKAYLMLKDIFPQNAVDLGLMSKSGVKGLIYKYFRRKEKKLYALSDKIGCMSQANVDYIIKHNKEIPAHKVEVCPNCVDVKHIVCLTDEEKAEIRAKYGLSQNKKVFIYGGNLGKPQGIPFLVECLKSQEENDKAFFLIIGDGTEYNKLEGYMDEAKPNNAKLLKRIPKEDFDRLVAASDVGMIFLDCRFTIPNFPSRLLSYMQAGVPVFACTDVNTDIGKVVVDGGFGWWCESGNVEAFSRKLSEVLNADVKSMAQAELQYLQENFSAAKAFDIIMNICD